FTFHAHFRRPADPASIKNWSHGQWNFIPWRAVLLLESFQMTTGNQLAQQQPRSTTVCVIGPPLPSRAPTTNPSPLRPAFLIANGILESALTLSKQTIATPSNREKFSGPRINKSACEVSIASEA